MAQALRTYLRALVERLVYGSTPATRFADVFSQATYFAEHLAKRHALANGNKRTAVIMSLSIIRMRGIGLRVADPPDPSENEPYIWIQGIVPGSRSKEELADWLRSVASL